ncbi:MAG: CDP-diacylglycerol--serine O-phosphatidyltransferase, partial [Bacteriovoracaceae bacterium]|nr:CDP-diacylglycerol--serine O-phosphatidyltransferase [Bacteriovoracaceae bacterium]
FIAIMFSIQGEFYKACMFIFLGAIFDSVDGRVARMTGTSSSFGEQFDSLSDLISFGIAPAIIFYNRFLTESGRVGMVIAFLFLLCGALRLARFNANISKVKSDYFQGLPIPGAALAVLSYILVSLDFEVFNNLYIAIPYIVFYAVLMISSLPFPSFKNSDWVRKNKKKVLFLVFLVISSLFIYEQVMIPVIISLYVLLSLIYAALNREKFQGVFDWEDSELGESTQK